MKKFTVLKTTLNKYTILAVFCCFIASGCALAQPWTFDFNFDDGVPGEQVTEFSDAAGGTYYNENIVYNGDGSAQMNINQGTTAFGTWGGRRSFPTSLSEGDEIWIRLRSFFPTGFDFSTNTGFLKFLRVHITSENGTHMGYHDLLINGNLSYLHANELGNTALRMEVFENEYIYAQNMIIGETIIGQTSGASATITGLKPTGYNFDYSTNSPAFSQFETIVGQTSGEDRTRMRYIRSNNNTTFGATSPVETNVWETVVYRLRFSASNPLLQFYKHINATGFDPDGRPIGGNLELIYEDTIDQTLKQATDTARAFLIFTYWNGGAPQTQNMYIDDLWISTNPPIEISQIDLVFKNSFE